MPPLDCGVGRPTTYQYDITLTAGVPVVADEVLALDDGALQQA
jgi:hypothetical protein